MKKDREQVKEELGREAVDRFVENGMKLGLGTGSTAVWAVRRVGELLTNGKLSRILAVATSSQTIIECQTLGIPLRSMGDPDIGGEVDLAAGLAFQPETAVVLGSPGPGRLCAPFSHRSGRPLPEKRTGRSGAEPQFLRHPDGQVRDQAKR